MDYYIKEFNSLQEEFHATVHEYPLFQEMIDRINDVDLKEIDDYLDKDDEYYLKKAISKLKDLIKYVKDTSIEISKQYKEYSNSARIWENSDVTNVPQEKLEKMNTMIQKSNELIGSHNLKDLRDANKIIYELIKDIKYYQGRK